MRPHREAQELSALHSAAPPPGPAAAAVALFALTGLRKTGVCTRWVEQKGYGFIKPDDGSPEIFVHKGALRDPERIGELAAGEKVEFTVVGTERGRVAATDVTGPGGAALTGRVWWNVQTGVVVKWNEARGFGYIKPDKEGEHIFVHENDIRRDPLPTPRKFEGNYMMPPRRVLKDLQQMNFKRLSVMDRVEYTPYQDPDGRWKAVNVSKVELKPKEEEEDFDFKSWLPEVAGKGGQDAESEAEEEPEDEDVVKYDDEEEALFKGWGVQEVRRIRHEQAKAKQDE
eukprot:EG_transcript_14271